MVIEVKQDGKFVKIPFISTNYPVGEAPEDGKQYARKDGDWSEVIIPEVDLTEIETAIVDNATDIAANTAAIAANTTAIDTKVDKISGKQLSTEDYTTADKTKVSNLPTPDSIVVTTDPRLTVATTTKAGLMSAADKVQLDSTLTATEIENKVNAAVSSVYRVKGTVASVSNLPTSDVAIGDVWNIADNGANYVATNNSPVEWDKLSETVDLTPYMLTTTANNTFVKKAGDTMTGSLTINSTSDGILLQKNGVTKGALSTDTSYVYLYNAARKKSLAYYDDGRLEFEGTKVALKDDIGELAIHASAGSNRRAIFNNAGITIVPAETRNDNGIIFVNQNRTATLGKIGALTVGDSTDAFYTYMGWGSQAQEGANNLSVGADRLLYKNIPIALTNDTKAITIKTASTNRAQFTYSGVNIIPLPTSNATGLTWRTQDDSNLLGEIGAYSVGDNKEIYKLFMGWGSTPYADEDSLSVSKNLFTYKNNKVWHAGNDGAGSGLDADTVDGVQAAAFTRKDGSHLVDLNTINETSFVTCPTNASATPENNYPIKEAGGLMSIGAAYNSTNQIYGSYYSNRWFARGGGDSLTSRTKWREFAFKDQQVVLTQAEYNALGSTVNSDNVIYFIKE